MKNIKELISTYDINYITLDSRQAKEKSLFVAMQGAVSNGNDYIEKALSQGAGLVFSDDPQKSGDKVHYIPELRSQLPTIAASFYKSLPKNIYAVTGTNGKSSVADLVRQLLVLCGKEAVSLGTLGIYRNNDFVRELSHTSPDIFSFYHLLSEFSRADNLVFEASSHGLEQKRIGDLQVKAAIFTNLTQDHLDYHGDMESYFQAKLLLFSNHLASDGVAIINVDDEYGVRLKNELTGYKVIEFGKNAKDLKILKLALDKVSLSYEGNEYAIDLPLVGEFQVYNILASFALMLSQGYEARDLVDKLQRLKPIRGRLEEVVNKRGIRSFVDYAHTPDALEKALTALRPYVKNRLGVVFGCGGDRDQGKRAKMAEIAQKFADYVVVTDDNPRTENASDIRAEIMSNIKGALEVAERKKAIFKILEDAKEGDIVLVAGKGHEDYQIIGTEKHPFDDKEAILEYWGKNVE